MKKQKTIVLTIIAMLFITHQSYAGWVISSGTTVKVPAGKYLKVDGNLHLKTSSELANEGLVALSGNFDNQGEAILGNGTFSFNGTGSQQITGISVFGNLAVQSGASAEIQTGAEVTVSGTTTNANGTSGIIVKSDASGSGSLIHNTTSVQGIVEEYLTSGHWHYVSAPISDAELGLYFDIYLMDWNEPTASWAYLTDPLTLPLDEGLGFSAWASDQYTGSATVDFAGTLNASDLALSLDYTPASSQTGWNLVGNPFSSAIDWNTNWTMNDVGGWALVYDNTVSKGWNPYLPEGSQSYNGKTDGIIPLTQGFWVRATDAGANITLPTSERIHSSQAFYKEATEVVAPTLRLAVEGNNHSDEAVVIFLEGATPAFDGPYDLEKFSSNDAPKLFSLMGSSELSVNVLPENFPELANPSVDMGFEMPVTGACSITASGIESFDSDLPIYLEDLKEDQIIDLKQQGEYAFASDPLDEVHRFILHFGDPLDIEEKLDGSFVHVYGGDGQIYISMDKSISGVATIFDMMGREVGKITLDGSGNSYSLPVEGKLFYLVQVVGEEGVWNKKVYVY